MYLPLRIAWRYLFAKKSHNVINLISAISALGMATGTAALIVILSVYNGFDSLVRTSLGSVEPDLLILPSKGKFFSPDERKFLEIASDPAVKTACAILQDNVYLSHEGKGSIALAKGVDSLYETSSPLRERLVDGKFQFHKGDVPQAVAGAGLAWTLDLNPRFLSPLFVYYPDRQGRFSPSNPSASMRSAKVWTGGIVSVSTDVDAGLLLLPMETMRELTGETERISGLELRLNDPGDASRLRKLWSAELSPEFKILDRARQNESLYKMMRTEKAAVYLILVFVLIIIAFNIFGSLSMLIIEKKEDISTLSALGATKEMTDRIFVLEGWLISLCGMAAGLIAGCLVVWLQQHFGLVKMPGSFALTAYPVIIKAADIIITATSVAVIGYIIAFLPVLRREKSPWEACSR